MPFQKWNEENFIEEISHFFSIRSPLTGIGDDCAVIPTKEGKGWLITTDALVEGVHFLKEEISPSLLGYKTVAVNVSDIAAMGGHPGYAFLSIALPKDLNNQWISELIKGIHEACQRWKILLLGGDTVGSKRDIFINLTLIGIAPLETIKYRHHAQEGDVICVTGYLGNAGAGLCALQQKIAQTESVSRLIHAHFHPEPNPEQGMWLASRKEVHAMMDLSDGLHCDLPKLLKKSHKGAVIEMSSLPLSEDLMQESLKHGWDPHQFALTGGEDYCLLLTIAPESFQEIQKAFHIKFCTPLFPIGKIIKEQNSLLYLMNGKEKTLNYSNFDHFQ